MKVIDSGGDHTIVEIGDQCYSIKSDVYQNLIASGANIEAILPIVASVKASDVKAFDPEKAARARAKAEEERALAVFQTALDGHTWSSKVSKLATKVAALRDELLERESEPLVLDLHDYEETTGLVHNPGQYSFRMVTRNNEKIAVIEVGLLNALPIVKARNDLETTETALRVAASDEVADLVPEVIAGNLRVNAFDVDDDGNIIFDVNVKAQRKGSGGKRRSKGVYTYDGQAYSSLTELGIATGSMSKYPHKAGAALIEKGLATFTPSEG